MTFNKLKIFVAVALIIFILVVANIIAFGLWKNNQDSNLATFTDSRKTQTSKTINSSTTLNNNRESSETSDDDSESEIKSSQQTQTTVTPSPSPLPSPSLTPVTSHPVTRAS